MRKEKGSRAGHLTFKPSMFRGSRSLGYSSLVKSRGMTRVQIVSVSPPGGFLPVGKQFLGSSVCPALFPCCDCSDSMGSIFHEALDFPESYSPWQLG